MEKYKNMMFFDAETGGGEGGGAPAPSGEAGLTRGAEAFEPVPTKITTSERPLPGEKPPVPAQTEPKPGEEGASVPAFDPAKFAQEFGATLGATLKPVIEQGRQAAPPMTPEEARRLLNVWEPDDAWYAKYDNLDSRKDAVAMMRDALIKQADTLAQYRMQEMIDNLKREVMPHLQSVAEMSNRQREERFHATYPQLSHPELQPLVSAVSQDLVARGQRFRTEGEVFAALAKGVEAVIKVNNPEFKLEATPNGAPSSTEGRGGRQIPVTTPGGGGGTGRREGGQQTAKPRGLAIFDK